MSKNNKMIIFPETPIYNIAYDESVNVMYVDFYSEELKPVVKGSINFGNNYIILDGDGKGNVVGMEILMPTRLWEEPSKVTEADIRGIICTIQLLENMDKNEALS